MRAARAVTHARSHARAPTQSNPLAITMRTRAQARHDTTQRLQGCTRPSERGAPTTARSCQIWRRFAGLLRRRKDQRCGHMQRGCRSRAPAARAGESRAMELPRSGARWGERCGRMQLHRRWRCGCCQRARTEEVQRLRLQTSWCTNQALPNSQADTTTCCQALARLFFLVRLTR